MFNILGVIQLVLTIVLAWIATRTARQLEKAKIVGAGLVRYMVEQGLELPPPEVMTQIINGYFREEDA